MASLPDKNRQLHRPHCKIIKSMGSLKCTIVIIDDFSTTSSGLTILLLLWLLVICAILPSFLTETEW